MRHPALILALLTGSADGVSTSFAEPLSLLQANATAMEIPAVERLVPEPGGAGSSSDALSRNSMMEQWDMSDDSGESGYSAPPNGVATTATPGSPVDGAAAAGSAGTICIGQVQLSSP